MSLRQLCEQFDHWRRESRDLVLATVADTAGSTYSKAGAQMLIADGCQHRGLLSGGCLEGDLMLHAATCQREQRAQRVSYDMRDRTEDEMWGLGLGCDGALDIVLQPLRADTHWQPFAAIADAVRAGTPAAFALVTGSAAAPARPDLLGSTVVVHAPSPQGPDTAHHHLTAPVHQPAFVEELARRCREALATGSRERVIVSHGETPLQVLVTPVNIPVRLLILGAGPDTVPLLRMARELGWYVTQADHRPASLGAAAGEAPVDASVEVAPGHLGEHLDLARFDAAVVMTHHLASDRAHLGELACSPVPFIGLLGPAARRRRLLADVTAVLSRDGTHREGLRDARGLTARTHGPVGLDIGARDPAAIALSILAQVQQFHARYQ